VNAKQLRAMAADPVAFREALMIPAARGSARLADVMADFQAKDFAALDRAFAALTRHEQPDPPRVWLERTKGASKDSDLAVMLLWLLAFSSRPLVCQVGAGDQDQADELRKAAKLILRLNPWLADAVAIQQWSALNVRTGSRCDIIAADIAGSHGARPDLLILNELSHVTKQEFAENLLDNAAKVPHGVVVIATNAGFVPSWQWNWRENARTSERWHWSAMQQPAPWLDKAEIAEAKKRNHPLRFARLWGGQWVRGLGDALAGDDIEAAVVLPGPLLTGATFYGGLDIGVSRDHAAFVGVGLTPDRRVGLSCVNDWAPTFSLFGRKVDLGKVQDGVQGAHKRLRFKKVLYDPHQCEQMAQNLIKLGVPLEACPFTVSNLTDMATALLERFHSHTVALYRDELLLADLHSLKLIDRGTSYRLDAARNSAGHGDRGTAFLLALLAAERYPSLPWDVAGLAVGKACGGAPPGVFDIAAEQPMDKYGNRGGLADW